APAGSAPPRAPSARATVGRRTRATQKPRRAVASAQGSVVSLRLRKHSVTLPHSMEAALKALAEPNRRRILTLVRDEELTAGEIASHFAVSRPAVSQHLTVLKEAGLVHERRNGT